MAFSSTRHGFAIFPDFWRFFFIFPVSRLFFAAKKSDVSSGVLGRNAQLGFVPPPPPLLLRGVSNRTQFVSVFVYAASGVISDKQDFFFKCRLSLIKE